MERGEPGAGVMGGASADSEPRVPVVDLGPARRAVARGAAGGAALDAAAATWGDAMARYGFAVVTDHGIPRKEIDALFEASRAFFLGCSASAKAAFSFGPYGHPEGGFTALGAEAVSRTMGGAAPADLVESYVLTSASLAAPERHAAALVRCGAAYVAAARELLRLLHRLSARALGAPEDTFDRFYDAGASIALRLAHYPARGGPGDVARAEDESSERYGPHKDYQGFTLLAVEEPEDRCLEVWLQGRWCKVPCPKGAIIVNTGELMAHWTNGRWRPTLHRVIKGPRDRPRFSIPLFTGPNPEALVVPLGDPDSRRGIKAGEHLLMQIRKSQVIDSKSNL